MVVLAVGLLAAASMAEARGRGHDAPARALDDPLLGRAWALRAASVAGPHGAWTRARGAGSLVAIVDTGVDLDHPDVAANLWRNPHEVPRNGRDDDGNGIVDDVHGADLVHGDGRPDDDEGHGTHVAALAAARGGDGFGIAGVAPAARIMAVKVLDGARHGEPATIAAGVRYALAHGARIINLSVNGDEPSPDLEAALAAAARAGAVVVASAGNEGRSLDGAPSYPASSASPAVLAVGAVDRRDRVARFSNTGRAVDVLAPGVSVLSAAPGGGFAWRSGTSMSAAGVTGALALLASARPGATPARARAALLAASRAHGGRLDVAGAVRRLTRGA
jgi:subtilisin family serine protease